MKYVLIIVSLLVLTGLIVWNVVDIVRVARTRSKQKKLENKENESERKE